MTNENVPHGSILRPDKVLEPVAVEALLGYEKLKPMCRHVEGHIAIGWALMFFIGVQKSWTKPHNFHISGWMIDTCVGVDSISVSVFVFIFVDVDKYRIRNKSK